MESGLQGEPYRLLIFASVVTVLFVAVGDFITNGSFHNVKDMFDLSWVRMLIVTGIAGFLLGAISGKKIFEE